MLTLLARDNNLMLRAVGSQIKCSGQSDKRNKEFPINIMQNTYFEQDIAIPMYNVSSI